MTPVLQSENAFYQQNGHCYLRKRKIVIIEPKNMINGPKMMIIALILIIFAFHLGCQTLMFVIDAYQQK